MKKQTKQTLSVLFAMEAAGFMASLVTLPPPAKAVVVGATAAAALGVLTVAWVSRPAG